jgi:hypothetical protein
MKTNAFCKLVIATAILSLGYGAAAQDKQPKFYTDNGTKEAATKVDCASLTDLMIKVPIPSSAFKYDRIEMIALINLHTRNFGEENENKLRYALYYEQKKFGIKFDGKTEANLWLINPKDGKGDFLFEGSNHEISKEDLCGSTKKDKVDVQFTFYGYIKTGENQSYVEYNKTWESIPVYDEGTSLGEVNLTVLQISKKAKR